MELKLVTVYSPLLLVDLLIVPYGIETRVKLFYCLCNLLLIVPYGIETIIRSPSYSVTRLLIVPYGIETFESSAHDVSSKAFNRTLWN